jgi:hypothetical protein
MLDDSEIYLLWTSFVTCGTLAFVACAIPLASYVFGGKRYHKATPTRVLEMLRLCLLYIVLETLPSAALYTDVQVHHFLYPLPNMQMCVYISSPPPPPSSVARVLSSQRARIGFAGSKGALCIYCKLFTTCLELSWWSCGTRYELKTLVM